MGIYQGNVLTSYRPLAVLSVLVYAHSLAYFILWYLLSIRYTFIAVVFNCQRAFFVYDSQQHLDDRRIFSTLDNPWRTYPVKWFCCCFCRVPCWHSYYITMFHYLKNLWFFVVSLLSLPCLWLYYTPNPKRQKIHIFLIIGVLKTEEKPWFSTTGYGWLFLTLTEKLKQQIMYLSHIFIICYI